MFRVNVWYDGEINTSLLASGGDVGKFKQDWADCIAIEYTVTNDDYDIDDIVARMTDLGWSFPSDDITDIVDVNIEDYSKLNKARD